MSQSHAFIRVEVAGLFMAADVMKLESAKTVQGHDIEIDGARWHLHKNAKVNDAKNQDRHCDEQQWHLCD